MKFDAIQIKAFIKKHSLASVAVGFLLGHSGSNFLAAIIAGLVMPLFNPLLNGTDWRVHTLDVGPFAFQWGPIVADGFHLAAVIFVVVIVIKILECDEVIPNQGD